METKVKTYCVLDIETSGFDPLKEEILELGFVLVEIRNETLEIKEEWAKVFKPKKAVGPQILGLTGITQKELDEGENFFDHRESLQEKLGDAVIIGHNVGFDMKFLEVAGLKFSGETIDTLDLVQWLLPTHHSYNLENLMHTFEISHREAHRALADSKATLKLLERLLEIYQLLPKELKGQIVKLLKPFNFAWRPLLEVKLSPVKPAATVKTQKVKPAVSAGNFKYQTKRIFCFSFGQNVSENLADRLLNAKSKTLLVVPKAQQALSVFKSRPAVEPVVLPEWQFSEEKFDRLLERKDKTADELKFVLKVLVWRNTNWQTKTILDLNLSFFGGQFKSFITGGRIKLPAEKLATCDLPAFFYLSEHGLCINRQVIICGLAEFEAGLSSNIGTKTSWGYINYLLKSFYSPENPGSRTEFQLPVTEGLLASDLFFGLVNAMLQTDPPSFQYVKIEQIRFGETFNKISAAAENFIAKLKNVNQQLQSEDVAVFSQELENFFQDEDNRVKWIELAENRCALLSMPINITDLTEKALSPFNMMSFADDLTEPSVRQFFARRLGLEQFKFTDIEASEKPAKSHLQGDLFKSLTKLLPAKNPKINYHCLPQAVDDEFLQKILKSDSALSAAVLFASPLQLKEFYEQNFRQLKERMAVLAQLHSGGSNKIFRNFGIAEKSLLLATDKFILRHLTGQSAVDPVQNLPVKTLVICRLPFEQFTHPYQEAVSGSVENSFTDYALPKALYNFHSLLKFFYSPKLKDVYVLDSKLSKDYAKVFMNFYKFIPGGVLQGLSTVYPAGEKR